MTIQKSYNVPIDAVNDNPFYLDYIAGSLDRYFSHSKGNIETSFIERKLSFSRRTDVVEAIIEYNTGIEGSLNSIKSATDLTRADCFCVTTGQQAGFMGGPAYTLYKIITAIQLAKSYEKNFGCRCVPVFWLASEDHDFEEINHAYYFGEKGISKKVNFQWTEKGRSIFDLPISENISEATTKFFQDQHYLPYQQFSEEVFAPSADLYSKSLSMAFSRLFSEYGLVIIEPQVLQPFFPDFFQVALSKRENIKNSLTRVAFELKKDNYPVPLVPEQAGSLFHYVNGIRSRLSENVNDQTEDYSTDAALRPIFSDLALPSIANVLGPGEVAYHGMLKPIYSLFSVSQPLIVPRRSFTIVNENDEAVLKKFNLGWNDIMRSDFSIKSASAKLIKKNRLNLFDNARNELPAFWEPLKDFVIKADPNLLQTWERCLGDTEKSLNRLEERMINTLLSHNGADKKNLQTLLDRLWPQGKLQERMLASAYFISCYGSDFINELIKSSTFDDMVHEILICK